MFHVDVMDVYCERVGAGLLAEPLNAITNLSFILAAWAAWSLARRTGTLSPPVRTLILIGASVGVGSVLWHTLPNSLTFYLDVVPIIVFIVGYVWLYSRRVAGLTARSAVAAVAAFLVLTALAFPFSSVLHGALVYTPGLLVTAALGLHEARTGAAGHPTLLLAGGAYIAALFFRTLDNEVCGSVPIGTHFVWHTLVGLVTYLAMRSLILSLVSRAASSPERPPVSSGSRRR